MKAEHRHELKTNELAEWIADFPNWAKKNVKTIIYVAVFIVLIAASMWFKWYQKNVQSYKVKNQFTQMMTQLNETELGIIQAASQGMDVSYQLLKVADELEAAADNLKDKKMAALALIKSADARRNELHYRQVQPTGEVIAEQIEKAKAACNKALELSGDDPAVASAAKFALGLCAEETMNFDEAKQLYQQILDTPDYSTSVAFASAKQRIAIIDDYKQKPFFKASAPAPEAQAPTLQPAAPQINLQAPAEQPAEVTPQPPVQPANAPQN